MVERTSVCVIVAFDLVVTRFADSSNGAAGHAFFAGAFCIEEAVCVAVIVGSGGYRNLHMGYDRAYAHRLPARRNQTIAKAKGA